MGGRLTFVQGNEACVEAALYAGLDFFAGYPITPSTEIAELMSVRLPLKGGKFMQMEDEIASICAIIGASLTGQKVLTATSGPGFSLMQEGLGFAIMAEIPCVIVDVQRGGPSTGLPTKVSQGDVNQARWGVHGDHSIIALTASNHQDVFAITVDAFNFSETYRTPVILLFDEVIGHMRERLEIPAPGEIPLVERLKTSVREGVDYHPYLPREDGRLPMSDFGGVHRYNVTGLFHDMWGFPSDNPRVVHELLRHLVDKIEGHVRRADPLQGIFCGRRGDPSDFLRSIGAFGAARGLGPSQTRRADRIAGTADDLAVSRGAGAGEDEKRPLCGGCGDEHGSAFTVGQGGGGKAGAGLFVQPGGRSIDYTGGHPQYSAPDPG